MGEPKSEALRVLFWRDEILQVMFWLEGEGFGPEADAKLIERFLGVDARIGVRYLDRLVEEGYLRRDDHGRYTLTERGRAEGGRIFSEEFAELMGPRHGECGDDCWCHASPEEAEACLQERLAAGGEDR
jgi:DNA-binding MarR family transcriptional regulator